MGKACLMMRLPPLTSKPRVGWMARCFRPGLATAAVLAMASCQSAASDRPAAPAPPPVIDLKLTEYRFDPEPARVPAGRVVFRLLNRGDQGHQPTLLALPEDLPPILEQLKGENRRDVETIASNSGLRAGVSAAVAADLEPGKRYAFVCYAKTPDGKEHSRMGMAWEFRTPGAAATTATTLPQR